MRFLVDAQLPRRMVAWLNNAGCDAVHTLDLPDRNRSTDDQIIEFAEQEQRIVVSKDADFVSSHLLSARPPKLLLVSTGNISNQELEQMMVPRSPASLRSSRRTCSLSWDGRGWSFGHRLLPMPAALRPSASSWTRCRPKRRSSSKSAAATS